MASIVLVHGISVRGDDYHRMYGLVKENLKGHVIVPCLWGDDFGACFSTRGLSVPRAGDSSAHDSDAPVEAEAAALPGSELWDVLYGDPFYELAILRTKPEKKIATLPGFSATNTWTDRLAALGTDESLAAELEPLMISQAILKAAAKDLQQASGSEFREAVEQHGADEDLLAPAISRALVAIAANSLRDSPDALPVDTDEWRNEAAQSITFALVGEAKGFVTRFFGPGILRLASRAVRARRSKTTRAIAPFVGDVLTYLARGSEIRGLLAACVRKAEPPVVLLAHSLGGIVCVEYLIELLRKGERTPVERVVTVGSQSGLLYEFNALPTCPFASIPVPLPKGFPPWLNIWHRNDLLAYLAEPIFRNAESDNHVQDVEVYSRDEFPESHSAYWDNSEVYAEILRQIQ